MEYIARQGYDAYLLDVRGYGLSTRPPQMDRPPRDSQPFASTEDAMRDVDAVVDFVRKRRGLTNAPYKRSVEVGEGTHTVILEKNRMSVFREVQLFLDEVHHQAQ